MRTLMSALCPVMILALVSSPGLCNIELDARATVEKPDANSYQGTLQANNTWYANVPFETTTSYVKATGGQPNSWAGISWSIQIGEGPSNNSMTVAAQAYGYLIRFDSDGTWNKTPQLSGSLWVALGPRVARTISEVSTSNTSKCVTATRDFGVVAPQGGGGGGGGGGDA